MIIRTERGRLQEKEKMNCKKLSQNANTNKAKEYIWLELTAANDRDVDDSKH